MKHPLAKAWDEWTVSEEGQKSQEPSILRNAKSQEYLLNRLWSAFMAGAEAQEKIEREREKQK